MAESYLRLAARHIDTAGDLMGTSQADILACYASNVLQGSLGSLALIRKLWAAIKPATGEKP
jgi:uncharacterized membrane protein